jgi:hypothetical protein
MSGMYSTEVRLRLAPATPPAESERRLVVIVDRPKPGPVGDCDARGWTRDGRYLICYRTEGHADDHWDDADQEWWTVA